MSRRVTFFVLAASFALTATQASAAPDCSGDACNPAKPASSLWSFGRGEQNMPREAAPAPVEKLRVAQAPSPAYEVNDRKRRTRARYAPPYWYGYGFGYGNDHDNGYVVGLTAGPDGVVGTDPLYGGYFGKPVYLFAPNAKIITIDGGER